MEEKKTTAAKSLETTKLVSTFMKKRYAEAREAQEAGKAVAWVTVGNDAINAFKYAVSLILEIPLVYPENYGPLCCTKGVAPSFISQALAEGYSNLSCGYAKISLGYALQMAKEGKVPGNAPAGGMAKPLVLLPSSDWCDTHTKWFQALGRYLGVPCVIIDSLGPFTGDLDAADFAPYYLKYLIQEMKDCVTYLEKLTGKKLDMDRFCELVDIALEEAMLWHECNELRKAIPCPMGWGDAWACMAPCHFYTGHKEGLEFYRQLYAELKHRVDNKIGVISNEKYRLQWYEIAPWHTLAITNYLESLGAVGVIESWPYLPGPPPPIPEDVHDPYEQLAWWHLWWFVKYNRQARGESEHYRNQAYLNWARDYQVDGAILHWVTTCRGTSIGQVQYQDVLMKYAKVPSVIIEGDMIDPSFFNEAQFRIQANAFIETMDHYKRIRQQEGLPVAHPL